MFTVVCDNCGEDIGSDQESSCWNDDSYAEDNATESDWVKISGKHYCPKCYKRNEDGEVVITIKSKI